MWDRDKQTYWISRRGNPWKVIDIKTSEPVLDFPANYPICGEELEQLCFAENLDKARSIIQEIEKSIEVFTKRNYNSGVGRT
jgi:hypothetical protein